MNISTWLEDQRHLFWTLHIGGWTLWGVFGKYGLTLATLGEVTPNYHIYVAVITVIGVIIALGYV